MSQRFARVEVRGLKDVSAAISMYGQHIADEVSKAVEITAIQTRTDVQRMIRQPPKTGRVYKRGGVTHQASRPGEAPAWDGGTLGNSIYYRKVDPFTAAIGSNFEYAFILEFGRRSNPKGTMRPAWIPAAEKNAVRLRKRVAKIIREAKARTEGNTK